MQRAERASRSPWASCKRALALCLGLVAGTTSALNSTAARTTASSNCEAVNKGALNVDLAATASAVREVMLKAGDTLTFTFEGGDTPMGSLSLVVGMEPPRVLLAGPAGSRTSYVADHDGKFAFRFVKEGAAEAAFAASCRPAKAKAADKEKRHELSTKSLADLPLPPKVDFAGVEPDPAPLSVPTPRAPRSATGSASEGEPSRGAPKSATGLDTRLKWEGKSKEPSAPVVAERDDDAGAASLGLKYKLQPQIMIGVLAQFDAPGGAPFASPRGLSDRPWMAGPVATVQLAPGLALDARAAWGPGETIAADHLSGISTTERRLLDAKLASTQSFGAWRFSPSVKFNYAEEKPSGTAAATHDALGARTAGAGRVDVTPELAYRIEMPHALFIEPKAAVGSFWDVDSLSKIAPRSLTHEDMRLKATAGITIGSADGTKLQVGGGVEGAGPAAPDVWSGRLQLSVPLK
jgi:hypothetical protein